jgi:hypothetical protein
LGGKKKGTYIDIDPSILHSNNTSHTKNKVVGLLKNGNVLNLKSIKINNKEYCVTNTCTFDSTFQLICSSYVDSDVYADFVNLNWTNLFFGLISNAIRDGINSQIYKKRANILLNFVSKSIDEMSDG